MLLVLVAASLPATPLFPENTPKLSRPPTTSDPHSHYGHNPGKRGRSSGFRVRRMWPTGYASFRVVADHRVQLFRTGGQLIRSAADKPATAQGGPLSAS